MALIAFRPYAAHRRDLHPRQQSSGTATSNVTVSVSCSSTTSPTYTISVSVTGLTSGSFELQDNDGDTLTFSSNTTQTFATKYASGASYGVTLVSQPAGQTCSATNTSGTITANITVAVTCGAVSTGDTISVLPSGLKGRLSCKTTRATR